MGDWQPIETAPKDGQHLGGHASPCYGIKVWGYDLIHNTDGQWFDNRGFKVYPTHWAPLLEPPWEKISD